MERVTRNSFKSRVLGREFSYCALLPVDFAATEKCFPVLYLLHGLFGSGESFIELTDLQLLTEGISVVVIMPNSGDNWYTDGEEKYETFLTGELINEVENRYRINKKRDSRAVAGLSMGGYGAVKFALKFPELFDCASSVSGAFMAPKLADQDFDKEGFGELSPSVLQVFGDEKGNLRRVENDIFEIVEKMDKKKLETLPFIYLECGVDDAFIENNRSFAGLLRAKDIAHNYIEGIGGHDWSYWNSWIKNLLQMVELRFHCHINEKLNFVELN